ncbi:MAG: PAS domain S-box protein [Acidobacteriia bacterium]|nr:PAS domain S-box protein [Terriglobia bacterium]
MRFSSESAQWMAVALSTDGLITSFSSAAEQVTGYSAHELAGRPITTILAERSVFEVPQMMKAAGDWGLWEGEIVHRNRSGKSLQAHASMVQLSAHGNCCTGFLLLSCLDYRLAGDAAGASLGDVAARLRETAHELNNPLAVMMGFTQLILLDPRCEGKMRADMERIYSEMQRVIQVVERLHAYAVSLQESKPEPALKTI